MKRNRIMKRNRMMKRKRIPELEAEVAQGDKLISEEKKAVKRAKGKVAKDNKRRALKVMKKSVAALQDQEDIIRRGGRILD
jgi:hypothetical protein